MSPEAKHPPQAIANSALDIRATPARQEPPRAGRWANAVARLATPVAIAALAPFFRSWHWSLDLASCFPVQAILALSCATILLAIGRKFRLAALFACVCLLSTAANLTCFWGTDNSPDSVDNTTHLDLLSLNLLKGNEQGGPALLAVIRAAEPDVIWCAEYTPGWQAFLQSELREYPYRCEKATEGSFGAALFSRLPLAQAEMIPLAHHWAPACRAVITTKSGPIGFLGVHPPPPGLSSRRVEERNRALAAIPAKLEPLPTRRIVCGDFNATPWNAPFGELLRQANLQPGSSRSWLPTWPANLPMPLRIPIDHILVTQGLTVQNAQLAPSFGSDHLPLLATVGTVPD